MQGAVKGSAPVLTPARVNDPHAVPGEADTNHL